MMGKEEIKRTIFIEEQRQIKKAKKF